MASRARSLRDDTRCVARLATAFDDLDLTASWTTTSESIMLDTRTTATHSCSLMNQGALELDGRPDSPSSLVELCLGTSAPQRPARGTDAELWTRDFKEGVTKRDARLLVGERSLELVVPALARPPASRGDFLPQPQLPSSSTPCKPSRTSSLPPRPPRRSTLRRRSPSSRRRRRSVAPSRSPPVALQC